MSTLKQLVDDFGLFDNWEDRYRYLIDLGKNLPPMDEDLKVEQNLVRGCTSKVWMHMQTRQDDQGRDVLHFTADSDAQIVRGLIHVLMIAYQDKPLENVGDIDMEEWFGQLGLSSHLSPNRRNGFFAMVSYIKTYTEKKAA